MRENSASRRNSPRSIRNGDGRRSELNGDSPLSRVERLKYLAGNSLRNLQGSFRSLQSRRFHAVQLEPGKASPSRKILDQLLSSELARVPERTIRVLDIGCGSGYFVDVLESQGFSGDYTGIDIAKHPLFDKKGTGKFRKHLILEQIESLNGKWTEAFDLVLSNTALEHIANDGQAVDIGYNALKPGGLAIHIVPAPLALYLYLYHGYRQYSKRSIRELFDGTDYHVWRIGGIFSFWVHFLMITIPTHFLGHDRLRALKSYPRVVEWANWLDSHIPLFPHLYAVVQRKPI